MKILFAGDAAFEAYKSGMNVNVAKQLVKGVLSVFQNADFRMLNLESVLYDGTDDGVVKSGPCLRCPTNCTEFLKALDINVAGLANNHFGDYGTSGMDSTYHCLEKAGIAFVGAGESIDRAYQAHVFEKDGIRVAVIACCENEFGAADENNAGTAGYNLYRLCTRIREEKSRADYVMVYFHGGNENDPFPSPGKNQLYRHWIDCDADAVIAMHTHCPQGYELYKGKPVIYSMGNFFFPSEKKDPDCSWCFGYLTQMNFSSAGISIVLYPYRFSGLSEPIELLSGENKEKFLRYMKQLNAPVCSPERLTHLFKIWCTMDGVGYASMVKYNETMLSGGAQESCHLRNMFNCEAHNELLSRLFEMCYYDEVQHYSQLQDEIKKYWYPLL